MSIAKPIRAFIAVKIPATPSLRKVSRQLAEMGRPVKAVAADNLHVTLKFLGDTDPELIPEISGIVEAAAAAESASELRVVGLGAFPHLDRPSVVWAGLQDAETLTAIAAKLEKRLKPLGFKPERRKFQPHLTLARIRSKPPPEVKTLVTEHSSTEFGTATVESVELFQSELRPEGPRYTILRSAELVGD